VQLPDANNRLQAVISGNGIALLNELAKPEIDAGLLAPLSKISLEGYGYYVIPIKTVACLRQQHGLRSGSKISRFDLI
jgi:hypothetical protein